LNSVYGTSGKDFTYTTSLFVNLKEY
jgi:hypothetical protein